MPSQRKKSKTIELKYDTWRKLTDLKLDQDKRSLDDVVKDLMDRRVGETA